MIWYSHLLKNFPQSVVIHIVKGFGVVNKAKVVVFLKLSCFFDDPVDVGNLISGSSAFFFDWYEVIPLCSFIFFYFFFHLFLLVRG